MRNAESAAPRTVSGGAGGDPGGHYERFDLIRAEWKRYLHYVEVPGCRANISPSPSRICRRIHPCMRRACRIPRFDRSDLTRSRDGLDLTRTRARCAFRREALLKRETDVNA